MTSPSHLRFLAALAGLLAAPLLLASTYTVTSTGDTGMGTLRQAIEDANATVAVADTITFNIVGAGVHTIAPASSLPNLTSPVTIDGENKFCPGNPNTRGEMAVFINRTFGLP